VRARLLPPPFGSSFLSSHLFFVTPLVVRPLAFSDRCVNIQERKLCVCVCACMHACVRQRGGEGTKHHGITTTVWDKGYACTRVPACVCARGIRDSTTVAAMPPQDYLSTCTPSIVTATLVCRRRLFRCATTPVSAVSKPKGLLTIIHK